MKVSRIAGAMLVAAVSAGALYFFAWRPYRCGMVIYRVQQATAAVLKERGDRAQAVAARRHLAQLEPCRNSSRSVVESYMVRGANLRILGRYEEAIREYETALIYDQRPEIFLNLGVTQIDAGQSEKGIANVTRAIEFSPSLFRSIGRSDVRNLVYPSYRKIVARESAIRGK